MPKSSLLEFFSEFCNQRQIEFSRYKQLLVPPGRSLAETLFWKFGKKLGSQYEAFNPVGLQAFILNVADGYISLLETLNKAKTLQNLSENIMTADTNS